ncbi:hypothetical protein TrLO_g7892 [Triparma laevis f. longispina]|uniref:peptidylprolyl isomerase n=2 Tax=Triparma laevis TaxID=1534972 RepID=A0A9W7L046_9STRA|nr:hypothetical protein TrLO_g7892 [Triparma laevis f. longispina]
MRILLLLTLLPAISSWTISRSTFIKSTAGIATAKLLTSTSPALASPEIFTTSKGVKYAITSPSKQSTTLGAPTSPQNDDICVISYTGYLTNGKIFDATHAEGKGKDLVFKLGEKQVIDGLDDLLREIKVGDKVQAIIPPSLAYGSRGVCIEKEGEEKECLIKPDETLIYDVFFKKISLPPP